MAVKLSDQITRATDELLKNPDWAANLAIIDRLNRQPDKCPKAADYLKKRLQHKNAEVATLALTLLDGLVKNCPHFIQFVATPSYMKAVVKLTEDPKTGLFRRKLDNEENILRGELKEKTLVLIQQWGKTFVRDRRFPIFFTTFQQLQNRGVRFPQPNVDEVAPVVTPPANRPARSARPPPERKEAGSLTDKQCIAAAENATLLWDMLTASAPQEDLKRNDLVQTLLNNCRAGQAHVMQRIQAGPSDVLMGELLLTNDKLLEAINYYSGLLNGTMQRYKPAATPKANTTEPDNKSPVPALSPPPGGPDAPPTFVLVGDEPAAGAVIKKKKKKKRRGEGSDDRVVQGREGESSPSKRVVPILSPPTSDKKKKGRKRSQGGSRVALPDLEQPAQAAQPAQPAPGEGDVLDMLFGAPEPELQRHVTDEAADDEFMALALREDDPPSSQKQQPPAAVDELDLFFDEIAGRDCA